MSVLIKGMEVPTSCVECPCCRHDNWNGETAHQCNVSFITFGAEDENWIYNTRPNWCPLIELPPHGRLIDADKLEKGFKRAIGTYLPKDPTRHMDIVDASKCHGWTQALTAVQEAETVIEADGA